MEITMVQLTLAQAIKQFPGCDTEDLLECATQNAVEPGYHKLCTLDGRLLSMCYEIGFLSWSIWDGEDWCNLEDASPELSVRMEMADKFIWKTV